MSAHVCFLQPVIFLVHRPRVRLFYVHKALLNGDFILSLFGPVISRVIFKWKHFVANSLPPY